MKLQLHSINSVQPETNIEYNISPLREYSKNLEDSQKAVENDFMKQEENFHKRLAKRINGRKILTSVGLSGESSINLT